jgi:hypothetical protein
MTEHLPECPSRCTEQAFCACRSAECICERLRECEERATAAAVQRVEELTIPHHFSTKVTLRVWSQVTAECITAIKGDQP